MQFTITSVGQQPANIGQREREREGKERNHGNQKARADIAEIRGPEDRGRQQQLAAGAIAEREQSQRREQKQRPQKPSR